jgi:hypothetical protein
VVARDGIEPPTPAFSGSKQLTFTTLGGTDGTASHWKALEVRVKLGLNLGRKLRQFSKSEAL